MMVYVLVTIVFVGLIGVIGYLAKKEDTDTCYRDWLEFLRKVSGK